jgi:hypothetical protein
MTDPTTDTAPDAVEPHAAEQEQATAAGINSLNGQIADAVAAAGAVVGDAAAVATGSLAQVIAQAAGLAMLNAVNAQQNAYITANATTAATVARILAARPAAAAEGKPHD